MCTLCLSDMDELRDEWLREPKPKALPTPEPVPAEPGAQPARLEAAA